MDQNQIASLYRQTSAHGGNPVGWVVKLYDAILEDFHRALDAITQGDIERRTSVLNHALLVIAELEGVLDHERGGIVARHLRGFYGVSRALIVKANVCSSHEEIERLVTLFLPVRQAWQHVEQDVARGKVVLAPRENLKERAPAPNVPIGTPDIINMSVNSRWSA